MKFFLTISFLILLSLPNALFAAACCSGGSAVPSLIAGDDRFQFRASVDGSFAVGEVKDNGKSVFFDDVTDEVSSGLLMTSAYHFSDRWQAGVKLPLRRRDLGDRSSQDFGDLKTNIAFEPFPLYQYSAWRPKVFVFAAMTFPTGTSTYETQDPRLESFGKGFFSPSLGFLTAKNFRNFDVFISGEWIYQFERSFSTERVEPGSIFSGSLGLGYQWQDFRFGVSTGPNYEEEKSFKRVGMVGSDKLVWDTSFDLTHDWSERVAVSLSYLDQSLMGPARNVTLTRSLSFSFLYRLPV